MNTEDLSVGLRGEDLACRGDLDFRGEDFRLAAKAIRAFVRIRAFVGRISGFARKDSDFRGEDAGFSWRGFLAFGTIAFQDDKKGTSLRLGFMAAPYNCGI